MTKGPVLELLDATLLEFAAILLLKFAMGLLLFILVWGVGVLLLIRA